MSERFTVSTTVRDRTHWSNKKKTIRQYSEHRLTTDDDTDHIELSLLKGDVNPTSFFGDLTSFLEVYNIYSHICQSSKFPTISLEFAQEFSDMLEREVNGNKYQNIHKTSFNECKISYLRAVFSNLNKLYEMELFHPINIDEFMFIYGLDNQSYVERGRLNITALTTRRLEHIHSVVLMEGSVEITSGGSTGMLHNGRLVMIYPSMTSAIVGLMSAPGMVNVPLTSESVARIVGVNSNAVFQSEDGTKLYYFLILREGYMNAK